MSECGTKLLGHAPWRILLLMILWWASVEPATAAPSWTELTLGEALEFLRAEGLPLVFTDELVRPHLRVVQEPVAEDPRGVLQELLEPHGLTVREAVGGRLVVVRSVESTLPGVSLLGTVRDADGGGPLPGVVVEVLNTGLSTTTDEEGQFKLDTLRPGTYTVEARDPGVVPLRRTVRVRAGAISEVAFALRSLLPTREEIEVTSARPRLVGADLAPIRLDRETLLTLPQLGDDVFRGLTLLPGTTGNDVSARFSIRGGRDDEVLVRLDGLEVLEPYHLKDFNDALSILAPAVIGQVELYRGQFPAEYGGRMSGVLDLTTAEPEETRLLRLGTTVLDVRGSGAGILGEDRGSWLTSLRGGSLELPFRLANEEENPVYWDAFGKIALDQGPGRELRANVLLSGDRLDFTEAEDTARETFRTSYRTIYGWLTRRALNRRDLATALRVSFSHVERDRQGSEIDEETMEPPQFSLEDKRRLHALTGAADWFLDRPRHTLRWGVELGTLDVRYDYFHERLTSDPLAVIRSGGPSGARVFEESLRGEQWSAYAADRWELGRHTELDLGLRFAENKVTDQEHLSPRVEWVQGVGEHTNLRLSWGHYFQSQRVYELQVEDGDTVFEPAELAVHWGLGFEHTWKTGGPGRDLHLRAELYRRSIDRPRVRYENLFDPISTVPELEPDRVRIAPEDSLSRGFELVLSGSAGPRVDWFLNYTRARITDRISGREVPRSMDQPHTVRLDFDVRGPRQIDFNVALRYHTGWPTTALTARLVTGDDGLQRIEPILGPLYGERVPAYLRVDVRARRIFALRHGELEVYLALQNAASRKNVRGYSFDFKLVEGEVEVERETKTWSRLLPTVGVSWSF